MATKLSKITTVADVASMAALPSTAQDDGARVYVKSLRSYFLLHRASTATVDGITVVGTTSGGRWLRDRSFAHPSWLLRSTFHVDTINGNDENDGTAATQGTGFAGPLKTVLEVSRRLGTRARINPPLAPSAAFPKARTLLINIIGDMQAGDLLTLDLVLGDSTMVWVRSANSASLATGSVASARVADPGDSIGGTWNARNVLAGISDPTVAWTNSALFVRRIRFTNTDRRAFCWSLISSIGVDVTMTTVGSSAGLDASISGPTARGPAFSCKSIGAADQLAPQAGDPYTVEYPGRVILGDIKVAFEGCSNVANQYLPAIYFSNCSFRGSSAVSTNNASSYTRFGAVDPVMEGIYTSSGQGDQFSMVAYGCLFEDAVCFDGTVKLVNCMLTQRVVVRSGLTVFEGGGFATGVFLMSLPGARAMFTYDFVVYGPRVLGTGLIVNRMAFFEATSGIGSALAVGAVLTDPNPGVNKASLPGGGVALATFNGISPRLWGAANRGTPVFVAPGCTMTVDANAEIFIKSSVGSDNDFALADSANGNTVVNSFDDASRTFTTPFAPTWANLKTNLANGAQWKSARIVCNP